jgi:hypothetical protein
MMMMKKMKKKKTMMKTTTTRLGRHASSAQPLHDRLAQAMARQHRNLR